MQPNTEFVKESAIWPVNKDRKGCWVCCTAEPWICEKYCKWLRCFTNVFSYLCLLLCVCVCLCLHKMQWYLFFIWPAELLVRMLLWFADAAFTHILPSWLPFILESSWIFLLGDLMKGKYVALKRTAEDRKEWQKLIRAGSLNLLLSRLLEDVRGLEQQQ